MNVRSCLRSAVTVLLGLVLASCGTEKLPDDHRQPSAPAQRSAPPVTPAALPPAVQPRAQPAPQSRAEKAKVAYAGELPPLPVTNFPLPRPHDIVKAVYEFAARRPDVLRYVPCFCGCERNGHVGNDDCFVAGREANGKPRWDAHGIG